MTTICGANCDECNFKESCNGCIVTDGNPFGGKCVAAEYFKAGGKDAFEEFKKTILKEINNLGIEGMPKVSELYSLCGFYVNLAYPMPSGADVKLLNDGRVYLGTQVECVFNDGRRNDRCFGIIADMSFILICEYGADGANPEIVLFKRR